MSALSPAFHTDTHPHTEPKSFTHTLMECTRAVIAALGKAATENGSRHAQATENSSSFIFRGAIEFRFNCLTLNNA